MLIDIASVTYPLNIFSKSTSGLLIISWYNNNLPGLHVKLIPLAFLNKNTNVLYKILLTIRASNVLFFKYLEPAYIHCTVNGHKTPATSVIVVNDNWDFGKTACQSTLVIQVLKKLLSTVVLAITWTFFVDAVWDEPDTLSSGEKTNLQNQMGKNLNLTA